MKATDELEQPGDKVGRAPTHSDARDPDSSVTAPLLEVRNLYVNYGGIQALADVSLAVKSGEMVTLIGANGRTRWCDWASRSVPRAGGCSPG
jgi:ABC-type molybdenum transport system ATPase subunit/photorepair protein PhrA